MDLSRLKSYHGYQSSIIPFSSGYYIYLASWDRTPTNFSSFSNLWVITPEDHRILFADPSSSSRIVCIYHEFQEIFGAAISLEWFSDEHLMVRCASVDGDHEINMELFLKETRSSRLLAALASSPPNPLMVSKPMVTISNLLANLLVTKGGMKMVGNTETGQPFYHGATDRLMIVQKGSTIMDGKDLGDISRPTWPVEFGDAIPIFQPVIKLGTLYIPYEKDMLVDGE